MSTLYDVIHSLCESRGITGGKLCTEIGLSKGILTDLKKGRRSGVSAVTAQKIASYFGVTVAYLLGEEKEIKKEPAAASDVLSEEEKAFLLWYRTQATEKDKAIVRAIIAGE